MPRLEFWYDLASSYSYLSASRIGGLAAAAGVEVVWRPFLLGPIFKAQGWVTSPFNVYPVKGRYMVRDITRIAAARGLPFRMPPEFPAASLAALRIALAGIEPGWTEAFSLAVLDAEFGRGEDIGGHDVLRRIASAIAGEANADAVIARSRQDDVKQKLRLQSNRAVELGIFGAPSFVARDGELFWGDDRLEHALRWAQLL
jgi:2-hydroxychromene-2-carboxylate isomerase